MSGSNSGPEVEAKFEVQSPQFRAGPQSKGEITVIRGVEVVREEVAQAVGAIDVATDEGGECDERDDDDDEGDDGDANYYDDEEEDQQFERVERVPAAESNDSE